MYIFSILFFFKVALSDLVVNTNSGLVQGVPSLLAEDVEAFLGIPYAEPPVGELRFAKPVPKRKWSNVYKAASLPPPCIQASIYPYYFLPDLANMSEDCLYLNIWAPKSEPIHGLRPVIVFFHHGNFVSGSSNMKVFDGSRLASRGDVIVVTINYRLGALGFLLAYTEEAEGSMGMYDQIIAIKWAKENARLFNGDPENIVLMGASAGAFSVSAHLVSPLSKNLFKKAIVQSGSLLNPMFADNTRLYASSKSVATLLGCKNQTMNLKNDSQSVLKCLKSKPKEDFAAAEENILATNPVVFYPRINDRFLPKTFADLLHEGKFRKDVDLLAGFNDDEGSMMLIVGMRDYLGYYGSNYENMNKFRAVAFSRGLSLLSRQPNNSKMTTFYLSRVKNRTPAGYTKMVGKIIGDFSTACNTVFLADFLSLKVNNVFFYKFGFKSPSTPMADWVGATHLDELQYVFGNPYHANFTSEEVELSHRLIDRWSAFARTGNPNIEGHIPWLQYSYHNPLYMNFGQEEESIRLLPNDRCEIWRDQFDAKFDPELIRSLTNSGMSIMGTYSLKLLNIFCFMTILYILLSFVIFIV